MLNAVVPEVFSEGCCRRKNNEIPLPFDYSKQNSSLPEYAYLMPVHGV